MWPLDDYRFDPKVLEALRARGFDCTPLDGGGVQAAKKQIAAIFAREPDGRLRLTEPPGYLIRGQFARLWDAGYQKFWLFGPPSAEAGEGRRLPVLSDQLKQLHEVSEELRMVLGIPSFYNESLGTTCHVTAYDRLRGRGVAAKK